MSGSDSNSDFPDIPASSPEMLEILASVRTVARTDVTVLIHDEGGLGLAQE
jgi:transcriptional regulator with PAS, ATPase and Fis domain